MTRAWRKWTLHDAAVWGRRDQRCTSVYLARWLSLKLNQLKRHRIGPNDADDNPSSRLAEILTTFAMERCKTCDDSLDAYNTTAWSVSLWMLSAVARMLGDECQLALKDLQQLHKTCDDANAALTASGPWQTIPREMPSAHRNDKARIARGRYCCTGRRCSATMRNSPPP